MTCGVLKISKFKQLILAALLIFQYSFLAIHSQLPPLQKKRSCSSPFFLHLHYGLSNSKEANRKTSTYFVLELLIILSEEVDKRFEL
jgi:hypothetical protein